MNEQNASKIGLKISQQMAKLHVCVVSISGFFFLGYGVG